MRSSASASSAARASSPAASRLGRLGAGVELGRALPRGCRLALGDVEVVARADLEAASGREALRVAGGLGGLQLLGRLRKGLPGLGDGALRLRHRVGRHRALGGQAQQDSWSSTARLRTSSTAS